MFAVESRPSVDSLLSVRQPLLYLAPVTPAKTWKGQQLLTINDRLLGIARVATNISSRTLCR